MAEWSGEYISPYAEHGKKSEQVKKITVSIPLKVLKSSPMNARVVR
ncbi:transcriptional repressor protein MetJ [Citrobacter koseri]|jgi:Transcriptional regulator of met regulon|uniref:Met repressor n=1 Tax=Citrobacter koseri TaxID=545 RepID=A0A3S4J4U3_CITKO|nr:transcriptional repressor protein MetJ [Citrobacter koseri]